MRSVFRKALLGAVLIFPTASEAQTNPTQRVPLCLQFPDTNTRVPCTGVVPIDKTTGDALDWREILGGGTDGTAGRGDASAANQSTQITAEQLIRDRLGDITTPVAGTVNGRLNSINTLLGSQFKQGQFIGNAAFGIAGSLPDFANTPTFNIGTTNGVALDSTVNSLFKAGQSIGNTAFAIDGKLPEFAATPTVNLGTTAGIAQDTTVSQLFKAGESIGNTAFGISGKLPDFATTPTVNLGTVPTLTTNIGSTGGLALDTTVDGLFKSGQLIGNTGFAINGTLPAFAATPTVNLGTIAGVATEATATTLFKAGQNIGNTAFGISGTLPAFAATPTVNVGTSALPTGAATSANQTTELGYLATLATATTATKTVQAADMLSVPTNTVSSLNAVVFSQDMTGYGSLSVQFLDTFSLAVTFQGSNDNTNWAQIPYVSATSTINGPLTPVANAVYVVGGQFRYIRAIVTSYTSGSMRANVFLRTFGINSTSTSVALSPTSNTIGNVLRASFFTDSTTALAANGVFTGTPRDSGISPGGLGPWGSFSCMFRADQASVTGGAQLQGSIDATTWYPLVTATLPAASSATGSTVITTPTFLRYHRCVLTNSTTAQTSNLITSRFGIGQ